LNEKISFYELKSNKAELLPSINSQTRNNQSWGRSIDPITNSFTTTQFSFYRASLNANMTLFSGLANLKQIKSAKYDLEIDKSEIQKIKNNLTFDIALKYITILYLEEVIKSNAKQIISSEKQMEIALLKFEKGYISESELFKIKSQKANEELTLTENSELLELNYIDLKQFLQFPLGKSLILKRYEEPLLNHLWMEEDKYSLLNEAIARTPSFRISEIISKKAKNEIALSRASFFPTLTVGGSLTSIYSDNIDMTFNQQYNNNLSYGLNFNLSIPLFDNLRNRYGLKQAKISFDQAKIEQKIEINAISRTIINAINTSKSAKKKYDTSLESFQYGKKSYDADLLKFNAGKININELNITKNNYINSQSDLIRAKYEYMYNNSVVLFYLGGEFRFN
jgi:outer membrane protein TolC